LLLADVTNHSARFLVLIHIFMCTILPKNKILINSIS